MVTNGKLQNTQSKEDGKKNIELKLKEAEIRIFSNSGHHEIRHSTSVEAKTAKKLQR